MNDLQAKFQNEPNNWNPGRFFLTWFGLGLQSFGGGVTTLALIRQAAVERHHWLSEEEFNREWALVQMVPGINLFAIIILIGKRVRGISGIALALLGLLLPSVCLTLMITVVYSRLRNQPVVQAALTGVIPATIGIGAMTAIQMALTSLHAGKREGMISLIAALIVIVLSGIAASFHWPTLLILISGGVIAVLIHSHPISEVKDEVEGK